MEKALKTSKENTVSCIENEIDTITIPVENYNPNHCGESPLEAYHTFNHTHVKEQFYNRYVKPVCEQDPAKGRVMERLLDELMLYEHDRGYDIGYDVALRHMGYDGESHGRKYFGNKE